MSVVHPGVPVNYSLESYCLITFQIDQSSILPLPQSSILQIFPLLQSSILPLPHCYRSSLTFLM